MKSQFQDSLDYFFTDQCSHNDLQSVKATQKCQKTGAKSVVFNENQNETHVYSYGGDPLYNLELKQPKKGILKRKKPQPEETAIKPSALPENHSKQVVGVQGHSESCLGEKKKIISPIADSPSQNTLCLFHFRDSEEEKKKGPSNETKQPPSGDSTQKNSVLKLPLHLIHSNDSESDAALHSIFGSPSSRGNTPKGTSSMKSPSNTEQKSLFTRMPENSPQHNYVMFSPRGDSPKYGTSPFKENDKAARLKAGVTDLNYVPQHTFPSVCRSHMSVFQQGAMEVLDDRKDHAEDNKAPHGLMKKENFQLDQKTSSRPELRVIEEDNSSPNEDNTHMLERLRRKPKRESESDYKFMKGCISPRNSSDLSRKDMMGFVSYAALH